MRRQARQWALMILYGMDLSGARGPRALSLFFESFGDGKPIDPPLSWDREAPYRVRLGSDRTGEARAFTETLVKGVETHRPVLDTSIQEASTNWRLERMAALDRNILRLAAFELLFLSGDVPRRVAINEAVELAKTFGTEGSSAFVNGVLDRVGVGA